MVENESYHMPVAYHDDQPNSYDETIPHDSPESGEIPTPYHEPPALQPTTPSGGAMGPSGISAPEDPSEVDGLRNQVFDDASMAYGANAVNDQAIVELTQTTGSLGHPEDPSSPASENSLQGAATMADYGGSQSSLTDSANPAAIAAGATASVEQPSTDQPGFFGRLKQLVLGSGEPSQAALRAEELRQRNREMQRNSGNASLRAQMGLVDQEGMQRSLDGIDTAGEYVKGAVLTAIDQTPIGISLALREAATGSDIQGNGVSRPLAGVRLLLSRLPGSRFGGGPLASAVNKLDDIGDGGRALAKGHAFAKTPIRRIAGTRGLQHSFDSHAAEWFARHGGTPSLDKWQKLIETASRSSKVVDWSTGADKTIGHLARVDGNKWFFVQFFKEGPRAGEVATAFIPNKDQVRAILDLLGK